jgi:hypothetical protein
MNRAVYPSVATLNTSPATAKLHLCCVQDGNTNLIEYKFGLQRFGPDQGDAAIL